MSEPSAVRPATLYVVATPIGNLQDITLRALDVLRGVDLVAAEDTRNTTGLLSRHGIRARLAAVHEHNERAAAEKLIELLGEGRSVALVSDAGTPAISDPGSRVVDAVRAAGFAVVPVPGACAAVAALSATGFDTRHFYFHGFLPEKAAARRKALEALRDVPDTMVFYEAPHRVLETVRDMGAVLGGERRLGVCRELTKLYEEIATLPLGEAADWMAQDANRQRGEFVLVVGGAPVAETDAVPDGARRALALLLGELPLARAVKLAVELTGIKKNLLYPLALSMQAAAEE